MKCLVLVLKESVISNAFHSQTYVIERDEAYKLETTFNNGPDSYASLLQTWESTVKWLDSLPDATREHKRLSLTVIELGVSDCDRMAVLTYGDDEKLKGYRYWLLTKSL